ncbi:hypothetical protein KJR85_28100, partial [Klebsiella pneumoniae]
NTDYSNTYSDSGSSPSLVVSVSHMLYDLVKFASSVSAADAAYYPAALDPVVYPTTEENHSGFDGSGRYSAIAEMGRRPAS